MQMERLTIKAQEALQTAQNIAKEHSHQELDCEHLLLALMQQPESLVPELLQKLGVPTQKLADDLNKDLAQRHKVQGAGDIFAGQALKKALDAAEEEARKLKDDYVSTEHLLLGILNTAGGLLKKTLTSVGLKTDAVMQAMAE